MLGDCSANIPRLVADHRRIFTEHFSRQNITNGSRKISMQALKILGIGKCSPMSTTNSDYLRKVQLYLPNIAWCLSVSIGNASVTLKKPSGTEPLTSVIPVDVRSLVYNFKLRWIYVYTTTDWFYTFPYTGATSAASTKWFNIYSTH